MKICKRCKRELDKSNFTKNKNMKDGLSYYCKECTKQQQKLFTQGEKTSYGEDKEYTILLLQRKNIPIKGLDKEKVINTVVKMEDLPNIYLSLGLDIADFLIKYNFTSDEYEFFLNQLKKNKFWVKSQAKSM